MARNAIAKTKTVARVEAPAKPLRVVVPKHVYSFGSGEAEGDGSQKELLGGKGANLAEMARLGLPVPPGFTITTEVCAHFYSHGKTYPKELKAEVGEHLSRIEKEL